MWQEPVKRLWAEERPDLTLTAKGSCGLLDTASSLGRSREIQLGAYGSSLGKTMVAGLRRRQREVDLEFIFKGEKSMLMEYMGIENSH